MRTVFLLLLLILILLTAELSAQRTYTLSGYVREASSGEELISATVAAPEARRGTYTNEYGYYALELPEGKHTVVYSYSGYETREVALTLSADQRYDAELAVYELDVVEISGEREDQNVSSTEMSTGRISVQAIRRQPALLGEFDVLRSIQMLPGVQAVGEGITGYYVRGGGSDQNLILLDEATVYNASHLLGFFSVFNPDALKDEVKLYKGGIPARYGGRLSSTLDLRMKEGNNQQFHLKGGIGLISSRLSVEGPLKKEKGSFSINGRRTYADAFLGLSSDPAISNNQLYFYDFNAKLNYRLGENDRLFLSGYFGQDKFRLQNRFANDWGNQTATLRWNHLFSDKLFFNLTAIYSNFDYGFDWDRGGGDQFRYDSQIRDLSLKMDFTHFVSPKVRLRYGAIVTLHDFVPGRFVPADSQSYYTAVALPNQYSLELGGYISNEHAITDQLSLSYGLRVSAFANVGPYTRYILDADGVTTIDSTVYQTGEVFSPYWGLEPRVSARFLIDEKNAVKASYQRTRQYLHLASNSAASFPWDIWVPSSEQLPPEIADQVAVGYFRNFADNVVEASVEVYYKQMENQFDFRDGAVLVLNDRIEEDFLFGEGAAYGVEFLVKKTRGATSGQIGYTLSRAMRQIDAINAGAIYPANSDRRHDISALISQRLGKRWTVATTFTYYSGAPITLPVGKYLFEGEYVEYFTERNGYRMPDYHRLDLSVSLDGKQREGRRWQSSWNLSVYNAYGRKNAFAFDFRPDPDNPSLTQAVKVYLFRWVPSVTYNFEF